MFFTFLTYANTNTAFYFVQAPIISHGTCQHFVSSQDCSFYSLCMDDSGLDGHDVRYYGNVSCQGFDEYSSDFDVEVWSFHFYVVLSLIVPLSLLYRAVIGFITSPNV